MLQLSLLLATLINTTHIANVTAYRSGYSSGGGKFPLALARCSMRVECFARRGVGVGSPAHGKRRLLGGSSLGSLPSHVSPLRRDNTGR